MALASIPLLAADRRLEEAVMHTPYNYQTIRRDIFLLTGDKKKADEAAAKMLARDARQRLGI
jgi:hypothetical protein